MMRFPCLPLGVATRALIATHVLLHVLLALFKGRLSKVRCHLRRRVIYKLPVLAKHICARLALLPLRPVRVPRGTPAIALMRLRRPRRRRR